MLFPNKIKKVIRSTFRSSKKTLHYHYANASHLSTNDSSKRLNTMFCSYVLPFSLRKCIFGLLFSILYFNAGQCNVKSFIVKIRRENGNKSTHMEARIVRGAAVDIERYPWSVLVFNSGALCAGTILNMFSILSAAHCFSHNNKISDISVHVGK